MKSGDLERNLAHLLEVTKAAQACLAAAEDEVSALRLVLGGEVPEVSASDRPAAAAPVPMKVVYK